MLSDLAKSILAASKPQNTVPKPVVAEVHKQELPPWQRAVKEGEFESLTDFMAAEMKAAYERRRQTR